jgi:hypothetical protein
MGVHLETMSEIASWIIEIKKVFKMFENHTKKTTS